MHQYKAPQKAHLSPFFQCYLVGAFPVHIAFHVYKDRPWTKCCKYVPLTFFTLPLRSCPKTWINQVNQEDGTSRVNQTLEHMYLLHPATTRKGATATAAALAQQQTDMFTQGDTAPPWISSPPSMHQFPALFLNPIVPAYHSTTC